MSLGQSIIEDELSLNLNSFKIACKQNVLGLAGLLGSHLMIDIYNSLLPIISPLLIQKYNLSLWSAGLLSASLSFTGAFMQPLYGYLSDRFQNKSLVLIAPLLIGLSTIGIAYAANFLTIFICLLGLGTGFSLYHPKTTAMVGSLSNRHRGAFLSFFVASGSLGSALSPLFVLLFISKDTNSLANLSLAWLPAALAFICILLAYHGHSTESKKKRSRLSLKQALTICSKPNLILLSSIVSLRSMTILTLIAFISQLITHSWDMSLQMAGLVALILNLGSLLGGLTGGLISGKMNPKLALSGSLILSVPCLLGFLFTKSFMLLGLGAFFSAWSNSICVSLSQQEVPTKAQSTASSLTMGFAWGVGAMIIPFVGLFADKTSLENSLAWFVPLPLILASLMCLFLNKGSNAAFKAALKNAIFIPTKKINDYER